MAKATREPLPAASRLVAAGHHQVGAGALGGKHPGDHLGRMLEVAVHDADDPPPGLAQAQDHGGAESADALRGGSVKHPDPRVAVGLSQQQEGGLVVTVVDEDQLEPNFGQSLAEPCQEGGDIARLVARGEHHAQLGRRRPSASGELRHRPQSNLDLDRGQGLLPNWKVA